MRVEQATDAVGAELWLAKIYVELFWGLFWENHYVSAKSRFLQLIWSLLFPSWNTDAMPGASPAL